MYDQIRYFFLCQKAETKKKSDMESKHFDLPRNNF